MQSAAFAATTECEMNDNERECLLAIARAAADLSFGKNKLRHLYLETTEGRDDWKHDGVLKTYSWCGDFVTWCLNRAGVLDGRILNRAALNGGHWTPGENISRILKWADSQGVLYTTAAGHKARRPGDIMVIDTKGGGHILFLDNWLDGDHSRFGSLDGNTQGGYTGRNNRTVAASWHPAVIYSVDISPMPTGVGASAFSDPITSSQLTGEEIAAGGDGDPPERSPF